LHDSTIALSGIHHIIDVGFNFSSSGILDLEGFDYNLKSDFMEVSRNVYIKLKVKMVSKFYML